MEYGLIGFGASLYARFLNPTTEYDLLSNLTFHSGGQRFATVINPPELSGFDFYTFSSFPIEEDASFPYGYEVEADQP